ncbi:MAG: DUF1146 domain-containing protein [Bacilli bacterium]|nr:DUF1146 domain-containing protein [Bacilli bacterium]
MSAKVILYIIVSVLVIWALEAVNINSIFKKNRVVQARVIYLLMALAIIYPVTNFLWDFFLLTKK